MKIIAVIFLFCASILSATAAGHFSIYTTNELALKHPLDKTSGVRLISIGADGLVTIKQRDGTVLTARLEKSKTFRNHYGHTTDVQLLSVSESRDRVVIRTEMRVYPVPPDKSLQPRPRSACVSRPRRDSRLLAWLRSPAMNDFG